MASEKFQQWWSEFASTGSISPINLGFTRDQVRQVLGEPDDFSVEKSGREPAIWKYENLEFHFGWKKDDPLNLIYMDTDDGVVRVCIPRLEESRWPPKSG